MFNFFAYMSRMKYIKRWNLMRSTTQENIMEHSGEVAQIAHALAVISNTYFDGNLNPDRIAVLGLYHETSEVITGDLPTPVKYYNPEIHKAYKDLEKIANNKLVGMLPKELQPTYNDLTNPEGLEEQIVKAADKISAYVKCLEEVKCGNGEFKKAQKSIKQQLDQNPLPCVKYFMEKFIPAYSKTLDELD
ncbi:MAG: 5'-deoxynucleotidase [Clostridia bacterium]|nr:5'-deoxynucleotidase [Clostridia bacterium]